MVTLYRNVKFYDAGAKMFSEHKPPREVFALARALEEANPADPIKAESLLFGYWDAAMARLHALDPNPENVLAGPESKGSPDGKS
jgi:hypothetical protein